MKKPLLNVMKFVFEFVFVIMIILNFFSCQKDYTQDLKDAQLCLNTAASSEARGCLTKIAGDTSAVANKLRCSAIFISEGYGSAASFINALNSLNSSGTCGTGCSSTVTAVTSLSFQSGNNALPANRDRNNATASEAFTYCALAETPIYMQISSLFRIGTLASMAAYTAGILGSTPTADEIKTAIGGLPPADMGAIAIATYASSCQNLDTASDSTKKYCTELGLTLDAGTGSATDVGTCFKARLANPAAICAP